MWAAKEAIIERLRAHEELKRALFKDCHVYTPYAAVAAGAFGVRVTLACVSRQAQHLPNLCVCECPSPLCKEPFVQQLGTTTGGDNL